MITTSVLFAGEKHRSGDRHCYFCGADCDESYSSADFIKETFTNRDAVKYPGSKYACAGCAASMGWGEDEMLMLDGTTKQRTNDKGMAPRMYSWLITRKEKRAFTKAHVGILRDKMLNGKMPEGEPFSLILADSGQKHLIFRAPVAVIMGSKNFPVMLEEEIIYVRPDELKKRLELALPVVAALGKPALADKDIGVSAFITYRKYHGNTTALEKWLEARNEPLSRLAAWLSKSKEDAQIECPRTEPGRIPEKTGGVNRPRETASRHGTGSNQGRGGQTLFDNA